MWLLHEDYYFIDQNGKKSSDHFIYFETYPSIRLGQEQKEKKTIPGRGNVWIKTGTYSDTEISMTLDVNVLGVGTDRMEAYAQAHLLLANLEEITFCDSPDFFYKVKTVSIGGVGQYTDNAGDFIVTLTCTPGAFIRQGTFEQPIENVLFNSYSLSHPEFHISGEGPCTLTVNGNEMKADVGQNLTIDTERMIAYRKDGTLLNATVSGDYEGLYLMHGENTIEITKGFELKVVPNWRYLS